MKKIITLFLAAGLVLGSFSNVTAAELKPSLNLNLTFVGSNSSDFMGDNRFEAYQRFRMGLDFISSENLAAFIQLESKSSNTKNTWGTDGYTPGGLQPVSVRMAYLDWKIPNSEIMFRMGKQFLEFPSFVMGSPLFGNTVPGVIASVPFGANIAVNALWMRSDSDSSLSGGETDTFAVVVPISYEGLAIIPYGGYSMAGNNSDFADLGAKTSFWFVGAALEMTSIDPFILAIDGYYGSTKVDSPGADYSGFYFAASAAYQTNFGTPAIKGWYSSGGDGNSKGTAPDFGLSNGGVKALTWYFDGSQGLGGTANLTSNLGTLGILAEWSDLSFINNLDSTLRVAYLKGTNKDAAAPISSFNALHTKDYLIEIDFVNTYNIYKNLAASLELAYIIPNFDRLPSSDPLNDKIFYAGLVFNYNF